MIKIQNSKDFLDGPVVRILRLHAFTASQGFKSLIGELRFHKPCGAAKKITTNLCLTDFT